MLSDEEMADRRRITELEDEIERLRVVLRETMPHIPADLLGRIETMLGVEQETGRTKP